MTYAKEIKKISEKYGLLKSQVRTILASNKDLNFDSSEESWQNAITIFQQIPDLRRQKNNAGLVYVARCDIFAVNVYKIGFTHSIDERIKTLTESLGVNQRLRDGNKNHKLSKIGYYPICTWEVPNKATYEAKLFQILFDYWLVGEIFEITLKELARLTWDFFPTTFKIYSPITEEDFYGEYLYRPTEFEPFKS